MKRFRFRLSRVLAVRQIRERIAEVELGQARHRLSEEQRRLAYLHASMDQSLDTLRTHLRSSFDPRTAVAHHAHIERLRGDVSQQVARVDVARHDVVRRQDALLQERQKRKALDRLRERQHQEYIGYVLSEEQKDLDDMKRVERR